MEETPIHKTELKKAIEGISLTKQAILTWESDYEAFVPELKKLELHAAISDLTKPISDLEHLQKSLAEKVKAAADNDTEINNISVKNEELLADATALFTEKFTAQNFEESLQEIRKNVTNLQLKTDALASEGMATSDAIKKEISNSRDAFFKSLNAGDYEENIKELTAYEAKLKGSSTGVSDEEVGQLDLLNTRFETVSNWLIKQREVEQITIDGKNEKQKQSKKEQEIKGLQKLLPAAKESIEKQNLELKSLELKQEEERKFKF